MDCPKCGTELLLDHMKDEKCFYTCINERCTEYLKAFQPISKEVTTAKIINRQ